MTTETTEPTVADQVIRANNEAIRSYQHRNRFMKAYAERINQIGVAPTGYGRCIDFDHLKHDQVIQVMLLFPGKWHKTINETKIDYTNRDFHGFTIRCWQGEPPPSCRIVEEVVKMPAQWVPAHDEIVKKLVCSNVDIPVKEEQTE